MCGITGYIDYENKIEDCNIRRMVDVMKHRGPDDQGTEIFKEFNFSIALGHARLSIIDLTPAGHQPMICGDYSIVYNGEVYNFQEIKKELCIRGHNFNSNSDTEVILHSYIEWGTKCVDRFMGMFAIAIYDKQRGCLFIARDRAGIKPLYYYKTGEKFAFASELKSLMVMPSFRRSINPESLSMYLQCGYVPNEFCIFENAYKLDAGCYLLYDIKKKRIKIKKYWDIEDFYMKPRLSLSYEDAKEELKRLCIQSAKAHLISDVPVGIFLSGGFDSTLVASIVSKELNIIPNTFTIGFYEGQNEAPDAEEAARILGTNHKTQYCTYKEAQDIIPKLPYYYDEPSSDISAIPTTMVSQIARKDVKVVLSSDGGDELFAGYNQYHMLVTSYDKINSIKGFLRYLYYSYKTKKRIPDNPFFSDTDILNNWYYIRHYFYNSKRRLPKDLVLGAFEYEKCATDYIFPPGKAYDARRTLGQVSAMSDKYEYNLVFNFHTLLKNWFLVKVDRATMSTSLEGREPLLDHRIMEFAAQLPWEYKYKDGVKKRIEKDIVYEYLPRDLMDKPKRGFAIPLYQWLKTDLRDYVMDTLNYNNVINAGLNPIHVENVLEWFMSDKLPLHFQIHGSSNMLWRIIQYVAWHNMWMK